MSTGVKSLRHHQCRAGAWKDTVPVPTGQTLGVLLDATHPGVWMAHCHIAEHHESGMNFSFHVKP